MDKSWMNGQIIPVIFHQHISLLQRDADFKDEEPSQQKDMFTELAEVYTCATSDAFKKPKILSQCTKKPESPRERDKKLRSPCLLGREEFGTNSSPSIMIYLSGLTPKAQNMTSR